MKRNWKLAFFHPKGGQSVRPDQEEITIDQNGVDKRGAEERMQETTEVRLVS